MAEGLHEIRVSVQGLKLGMFVCRLDRPWLEAKVLMQGLMVADEATLRHLQQVCRYVYVDILRGEAPDLRYVEYGESDLVQNERGKQEVAALRKTTWEVQQSVAQEQKQAEQAFVDAQSSVDQMMLDLQQGNRLDLKKLRHGVTAMVDSILRNPSALIWVREIRRSNEYAYQHAMGCAIWAASFGRHLGLEREELHNLALGGLLSDVGKTRLPMDLLSKPPPLTEQEAKLVRAHVRHSLDIVESIPGLHPKVIEMVATHHERHDGSGYPTGLRASEIPIFGRIMGIVDSYDAMTCVRPYAESRAPHQAVAELYTHRGSLFQSELVEQFIQNCGIYPTGSLVELSNGEVGVITAVHSLKRLRPCVMVLLDSGKRPLAKFRSVDLEKVELDAEGQPLSIRSGLAAGAYGIDPHELFLD
ncbi:HD-GYP domain-containing protein [Pseudomarimonas arenosa]|uniref:HD-GYP domain-containing protein n=1 Tax=Pseudomarimonas arenosa TaxID=2774145 RepID=A0AAW3ZNC9_9GAMM|nr:HD-GYP domain-containing protein [Pseudomarimonas arenosa]MBD8525801.1 HD-GYP domain-containing protein [Pseudomarimonas arenosa]